jgi:glutamate/aspartate transport system permease protein
MFSNFDFGAILQALPYLFLTGMVFTLKLTFFAALAGTALGTLLALMRLSGLFPLPQIAAGYVNLVRSLPLLLVIFWFYFLVPYIAQAIAGSERPITIDPFLSALITFSVFEAAYFSEIMRAGIQSLSKGQAAAGYALGLGYWQVMGEIVLPQAFRNMLPVLLTQTIVLFQDTSLVYVLSLNDFLGIAGKIGQRDGRLTEMYLFAAVVYFVFSYVASSAVRRLQSRTAIIR